MTLLVLSAERPERDSRLKARWPLCTLDTELSRGGARAAQPPRRMRDTARVGLGFHSNLPSRSYLPCNPTEATRVRVSQPSLDQVTAGRQPRYPRTRPSPQRHPTMTSQGTARGRFQRARLLANTDPARYERERRCVGLSAHRRASASAHRGRTRGLSSYRASPWEAKRRRRRTQTLDRPRIAAYGSLSRVCMRHPGLEDRYEVIPIDAVAPDATPRHWCAAAVDPARDSQLQHPVPATHP